MNFRTSIRHERTLGGLTTDGRVDAEAMLRVLGGSDVGETISLRKDQEQNTPGANQESQITINSVPDEITLTKEAQLIHDALNSGMSPVEIIDKPWFKEISSVMRASFYENVQNAAVQRNYVPNNTVIASQAPQVMQVASPQIVTVRQVPLTNTLGSNFFADIYGNVPSDADEGTRIRLGELNGAVNQLVAAGVSAESHGQGVGSRGIYRPADTSPIAEPMGGASAVAGILRSNTGETHRSKSARNGRGIKLLSGAVLVSLFSAAAATSTQPVHDKIAEVSYSHCQEHKIGCTAAKGAIVVIKKVKGALS